MFFVVKRDRELLEREEPQKISVRATPTVRSSRYLTVLGEAISNAVGVGRGTPPVEALGVGRHRQPVCT